MTAFTRDSSSFVIDSSSDSSFCGSILKVTGSISTNTGFAPSLAIQPAVAKKVKGVVITRSPCPVSRAIRARSSASVPEETPSAYLHWL